MRVLQVFNQYRSPFNGEQAVVRRTEQLLLRHGHSVRTLEKSSQDLSPGLAGKAYAFASGIYNPFAAGEIIREVKDFRPDIVHSHNIYPLFSPSIFRALHKHGIPVVLSLHNQQLTCPRADHLLDGKVCDTCLTSSAMNCALKNCRGNRMESWAYALRSQAARQFGMFRFHVTRFIALTRFARERLIQAGYDEQRISVLPNMAPGPFEAVDPAASRYFGFAGRLSAEKGVPILLAAAAQLPDVEFRLAGVGPDEANYRAIATENVQFLGKLDESEMTDFYRQARALILPSTNYEMCPLVIGEAMSHGVPVIASDIGGIPELVEANQSGLLFTPGDADQLTQHVATIRDDDQRTRQLGKSGWRRARQLFGEQHYLERLLSIYQQASGGSAGAGETTEQDTQANFSIPTMVDTTFVDSTRECT